MGRKVLCRWPARCFFNLWCSNWLSRRRPPSSMTSSGALSMSWTSCRSWSSSSQKTRRPMAGISYSTHSDLHRIYKTDDLPRCTALQSMVHATDPLSAAEVKHALGLMGCNQHHFQSSVQHDAEYQYSELYQSTRTRNVHKCTSSAYACCLQDIQHGRARPTQQAGHGGYSCKGVQLLQQRHCFSASEQRTAAGKESSRHLNGLNQA